MSFAIRYMPGIGHQVLRHNMQDRKSKVLGTYDERDEAEKRLDEELAQLPIFKHDRGFTHADMHKAVEETRAEDRKSHDSYE